MKTFALCLLLTAMAFLSGCAKSKDPLESRERVFYYDRNGDGKVDQEKHLVRGVAERDWELRDDDYDGRYEKKFFRGLGADLSYCPPVPTSVHIEAKP